MTVYILVLSVVLQFSAAIMAFRLIRVTGERVAWGFISAAIVLMTVRRCITLFHMIASGASYRADMQAELIALAISVLMVIGIARIAPLFRAIDRSRNDARHAQQELQVLKDELEVRVRERTAQIETANRELESFSYSVSHDLWVPLRAIDGFARLLADEYGDRLDDEGRRLLNVVRDNTHRMAQIMNDLLEFSRVDHVEMMRAEINMEELVHETIENLKPVMDGREIYVDYRPLPSTFADRDMMRRVWLILLSNAVKFTRVREIAHIEIGADRGERETVYFVRDDGVGFDMQYAGNLFGMFKRLHGVEEFEGTGIGLAMVKLIVTRHGGRVWAQGKVNEGATIYFALPDRESENG